MLCGSVILATGAGSRMVRMPASQFAVHMTVQSVMSGAKPHQNDLLLPEQQGGSRPSVTLAL